MNLIVDLNNFDKYQHFVKVSILRSLNTLRNLNKKYRLIHNNFHKSVNSYINALDEFESNKKRMFDNSQYKARYGVIIDVLLPKNEWYDYELKKLSSTYCRYIIQKEKGLKYAAWIVKKGQASYLKIYISDREVHETEKVKTYKRTMYVNKHTNIICKADDPDAIVKHKKGDFVLDQDGNKIVEQLEFKDRKTDLFKYKDSQYNSFIQMFKDFYLQAILKTLDKIKINFGKYFRRYNLKYGYDAFQKRIIKANNLLMQYIQNCINEELSKHIRYPDEYERNRLLYEPGEIIQTEPGKKFLKLFDKYSKIFKEKMFSIGNKNYKIAKCRVDIAEDNLEKLKKFFDRTFKAMKGGLYELHENEF